MALTHLDAEGQARMVGVSHKAETARTAVATAVVRMSSEALHAVATGTRKGDALQVARIAGIHGAKRTAELIPLCHPVRLTRVEVSAEVRDGAVHLQATAEAVDRTGVEMEALTAVSVAALTIYDMVKSVDNAAVIADVRLVEKDGGKSGRVFPHGR